MKELYHRLIPQRIRTPIGFARRILADDIRRLFARPPLPPRRLLAGIQMTPFLKEYLEVGRRSAWSVTRVLDRSGVSPERSVRVLDFGCGSARTLRHLERGQWELHGCDIDRDAIAWAAKSIPFVRFARNETEPPLPYPDGMFHAVLAISLFTHFDEGQQSIWIAELARVLGDRGIAVVSTMGPEVIEAFRGADTHENRATLAREGFVFVPGSGDFNSHGAFHSAKGVTRLFSPHFELVSSDLKGLDGFQDLYVLRKRP